MRVFVNVSVIVENDSQIGSKRRIHPPNVSVDSDIAVLSFFYLPCLLSNEVSAFIENAEREFSNKQIKIPQKTPNETPQKSKVLCKDATKWEKNNVKYKKKI